MGDRFVAHYGCGSAPVASRHCIGRPNNNQQFLLAYSNGRSKKIYAYEVNAKVALERLVSLNTEVVAWEIGQGLI